MVLSHFIYPNSQGEFTLPHRRDEIRKIIVDSLKNKTLAKENVFNWRLRPVQNEHSLPCISVLIPEETIIEISGAEDLIHRKSEVYVIIYCTISNHEDNMCDEIARQVEIVMNNLNTKYFLFKYKKMEISTENLSTKALILCALTYECSYFTKENIEIHTDNFKQLSIEVTNV